MADILRCWSRLQNKVNNESMFVHPDVPKKFEFIKNILNGDKVDTSEYTHLELIEFIDNITKNVSIAKDDWALITSIVLHVNAYYQDVDNSVNTTKDDIPNSPKEAQMEDIIFNDETINALNTLWDIENKIFNDMTHDDREKIFGYGAMYKIVKNHSAIDVINKYYHWCAFKEKQKKEFHVGEEVKGNESGRLSWVTHVEDKTVVTILNNGHFFVYDKNEITKTGRFNKTLTDIMNGGLENNSEIKDIEEDLV